MQLRYRLWTALLVLALAITWGMGAVRAEGGPVVRMVYFTAAECPHCAAVMNEVLAPLQAKYGDLMQIKVIEISDPANYEMLIRAEEMFGVSPEERGIPTLIVCGQVSIGEDAIRERLCCLLDRCLQVGGTSWPDIPGLQDIAVASQEGLGVGLNPGLEGVEPCGPEDTLACEAPLSIWAAYFYEVGCQECSRAEYDIRYAQSKYPQLLVEEHNIQEDAALAEWLGARVGIPQEQRLATPALFVGDEYLIGTDITPEAVLALVEKYALIGAERVWADFNPAAAKQSIIERFKSFGVLTVVFAGLIDGLNPCAFATIVFFISYLAFVGRQQREVLAVGLAFTLGVFLTYLGVGVGLLKFMGSLPFLSTVSRWVYGLTAALCLFLAALSLYDWWQARRGKPEDMRLKLPLRLRRWINRVIREGAGLRAFVPVSFVTGVMISLIELACTGQVYLPTIIFVLGVPGLQARAGLYLVLYNLVFILPLVVIFLLAYFGTTSQQLGQFINRRAATIKLATAGLFLLLAGWLVMALL